MRKPSLLLRFSLQTHRFFHLKNNTNILLLYLYNYSVYEGGHRVPFLSWWPLGTHKALYGSNFDLPVGNTDLFATFAEILKYPLPTGDQCKYSYNSENAHVYENDDKVLGRPAMTEGKVWTP